MWFKATVGLLMVCTAVDALAFDSYYRARIFLKTSHVLSGLGDLDWAGFLS